MEHAKMPNQTRKLCRIGLGTWAIGGWMWGGTDEQAAIHAIHHALDLGINLIDTAPVYGFGMSEQIVGKAIKTYEQRDRVFLATKMGLKWNGGELDRDSSRKRILKEIDDSLMRLQVDHIDLYQVHWPDPNTPASETASTLHELLKSGKILSIGVSNFSVLQMQEFRVSAPIHALQSPYNIFESELDKKELPHCKKEQIAILGYGSLCRGLLSGKITKQTEFKGDDLRQVDPKFQQPTLNNYLACVDKLKKWAETRYQKHLIALSLRWCLDKGIDFPLWGIRKPEHLEHLEEVWDWKLTQEDLKEIDRIISETIPNPIGPEFMAPKVHLKAQSKT